MDANPITSATLTEVVAAITAIGALGTAAFGLVDASKVVTWLVPSSGFGFIQKLVDKFAPADPDIPRDSALSADSISASLRANWINGMALADQKSVAKTLIKLRLDARTAAYLAGLTGVDAAGLLAVVTKLSTGEPMTTEDMNVYGRFDLLLATSIDYYYQKADQKYRTTAQLTAGFVAVLLSVWAAWLLGMLYPPVAAGGGGAMVNGPFSWDNFFKAVLVGLIALPLAPIAKNLATALTSAAGAVQSVKK